MSKARAKHSSCLSPDEKFCNMCRQHPSPDPDDGSYLSLLSHFGLKISERIVTEVFASGHRIRCRRKQAGPSSSVKYIGVGILV